MTDDDAVEEAVRAESPGADPLADERIQFYLRHRNAIREWAAIERDVRDATHELLLGLAPLVEAEVRDLDGTVLVQADDVDGRWPRIVLRRTAWPLRADGAALVGVSFEWTRANVDLFGGSLPYYGIRIDVGFPEGTALRAGADLVAARHGAALLPAGLKPNPRGSYWPVYGTLPKSSIWWIDRDPWVADVVRRMRLAWSPCAAIVEECVATVDG